MSNSFKPAFNLLPLLALVFVISSSFPHLGQSQSIETSAYTVTVRTLDHVSAGTSSVITFKIADKEGNVQFETRDLVAWGGWYKSADAFFQSGSLDALYGLGTPFASERPCYLMLIASGTGDKPTWGCDTVQVQTSSHGEKLFYVREWLTPDNNYTIVRDACAGKVAHDGLEKGMTRTTGSLPI